MTAVRHTFTPDRVQYRVPLVVGAPIYGQRDRAVRSLVLDLLEQDKTVLEVTWFINIDPRDRFNTQYMQLDAVVTNLYVEQA